MVRLALDPATTTGWATEDSSGIMNFKVNSHTSNGVKFLKFRNKIKELVELGEITMVFYERPSGQHFTGVRSGANFEGVLISLLEELGVKYMELTSTEIKKHAKTVCEEKFGVKIKGQMNKDKMVEWATKFFNRTFIDDNEADACWILHYSKTIL